MPNIIDRNDEQDLLKEILGNSNILSNTPKYYTESPKWMGTSLPEGIVRYIWYILLCAYHILFAW